MSPSPRGLQSGARRRERSGLFKHYRRHLNFLVLLFLFIGAAGWACRWKVFREVLLQVKKAELPDLLAREAWPILGETLRQDPAAERRRRAASLLAQDWRLRAHQRGPMVWNALLDATVDPDPTVELLAWAGLIGVGLDSPHSEPGLAGWIASLSVGRCVDVLRRTRASLIRKEFLQLIEDVDAEAYWSTAAWSLRSLDDPAAVDVVLDDTRNLLYWRGGGRISPNREHMWDCLDAGLENQTPRIRDRCRRLFLDYAYGGGGGVDFIEWIRSTRDVSTLERIVRLADGDPSLDWETPLKRRLAEETEFDKAVELSVAMVNMVRQARDREFLAAGLENPDPKIRAYFEQLLAQPPGGAEPLVEPEDGR